MSPIQVVEHSIRRMYHAKLAISMLVVISITFAFPSPRFNTAFECASEIHNLQGLSMCMLNTGGSVRFRCKDDDGRPTKWQVRAKWSGSGISHDSTRGILRFHTTESNDYGEYMYLDWGEIADPRQINVICSVENGREQVEGTLTQYQLRF